MRELCLLAVLAVIPGACHPQTPEPVEPGPGPVDPPPFIDPDPAPWPAPEPVGNTPCERACDRMLQLECAGAGPGCAATCERHEAEAELAPVFSWQPPCMIRAANCAELAACRGGS